MVFDEHGNAVVNANLTLQGAATYRALSDHRGRYRFEDIIAGDYDLVINFSGAGPSGEYGNGALQKKVTVRGDEMVDLTMAIDYQQPAMPYGAPPRRHRIV